MLGKHSIFTSDGIVCLYVNDMTDICVTYVVIIIRGASFVSIHRMQIYAAHKLLTSYHGNVFTLV